ncbi:hypothetical protein HK102_005768 [Quaeritorhiza haematococci]|nr:hypothetical protein HK102_005768 [Quaeritorhiza haematococci]
MSNPAPPANAVASSENKSTFSAVRMRPSSPPASPSKPRRMNSRPKSKPRINRMEEVYVERVLNIRQVLESQNRLLGANKRLLEEKVKSLEAQLNEARRMDEEHQETIQSLQYRAVQLEDEVVSFRGNKAAAETKVTELEKLVQDYEKETARLRKLLMIILQIESLRDEVEDLRSRLEKEKAVSQKEIKSLAAEKEHLEVWIKSLQKIVEEAQEKEEDSRRIAAETEASRAELSNQIKLLEAHLAGTNSIAEKRNRKSSRSSQITNGCQNRFDHSASTKNPAKLSSAQVEVAKVAISLLNTRLKATEARVSERNKEIVALTSAKTNLEEQLQILRQGKASHNRVVAELEETKSTLKSKSTRSKEVLPRQSQNYCQQEKTHRRLADEARALTGKLETRIASLETILKASHALVEKRGREINVLTSENAALTEQIQSLRQQEETHHHVVAGAEAAKI